MPARSPRIPFRLHVGALMALQFLLIIILCNSNILVIHAAPAGPSSFLLKKLVKSTQRNQLILFQSLEKPSLLEFGSEGAHLISRKDCKKIPQLSNMDNNENNRLALSRTLHGFIDGLSNNLKPVVKLNYIPPPPPLRNTSNSVHHHEFIKEIGRYRVTVGVECLNSKVLDLVVPMLKNNSRISPLNPFMREVDVLVRNKDEFIKSLVYKSKETENIWKNN